jgi:hypothetical protein
MRSKLLLIVLVILFGVILIELFYLFFNKSNKIFNNKPSNNYSFSEIKPSNNYSFSEIKPSNKQDLETLSVMIRAVQAKYSDLFFSGSIQTTYIGVIDDISIQPSLYVLQLSSLQKNGGAIIPFSLKPENVSITNTTGDALNIKELQQGDVIKIETIFDVKKEKFNIKIRKK